MKEWEKSGMAENSGSTTSTDPVCGMEVDPLRAAASGSFQGRTFYFCSVGCAKRFDEDPKRYAER